MRTRRTTPARPSLARTALGTATAVVATAAVGTLATDPDSAWYRGLRKPPWQPPKAAFPIVWTALYAGLGATSARALHALRADGRDEEAAAYRRSLAANLVLNAGWSALFWRSRRLSVAAVEAGLLTASTAALARRSGGARKGLGRTLVPYAAWSGFATVLSAAIARRNR